MPCEAAWHATLQITDPTIEIAGFGTIRTERQQPAITRDRRLRGQSAVTSNLDHAEGRGAGIGRTGRTNQNRSRNGDKCSRAGQHRREPAPD